MARMTTFKRLRPRWVRATMVVVAALVLAACNTLAGIDDEAVEQSITEELQRQVGLEVTSVECPTDRPLLQGDQFECTATGADGRQLVITVTQDDAEGNVSWEVTEERFPSPTP